MSLTFEGDGTISGFDAGLSGFGGLVAVKHVLKTNTQSSPVTAGGTVAVSGLSITHTLSDATNKLIISAYFGAAGTTQNRGGVGLIVLDGSTPLAVGASPGSRGPVTAGGSVSDTSPATTTIVTMPSATFVYEPGDTNSHTYSVSAYNFDTVTQTLYINRTRNDADDVFNPRTASGLIIQEVSV